MGGKTDRPLGAGLWGHGHPKASPRAAPLILPPANRGEWEAFKVKYSRKKGDTRILLPP